MKQKFINAYMDIAARFAELSYARRMKVGAIVVKNNRIISLGYNGTPAGWDNNCENISYNTSWVELPDKTWQNPNTYEVIENIDELYPHIDVNGKRYRLYTKPEVLHAERNALDKLARGTEGGEGASLFVTHSPCLECAKSIYGAGIKEVYYREEYRDPSGVNFLIKSGVKVTKV